MRRSIRPLMYFGIAAVVLGLSQIHAKYIADPPYSWHETFRFAWSLAYIAFLMLTAYGVGLPDLPRSPRNALVTSVVGAVAGAGFISVIQLLAGDALLPRFVVFGSAILLVPWYLLCVAVSGDAGAGTAGDRALVVSDTVSLQMLKKEINAGSEHEVAVVGVLSLGDADGGEAQPLVGAAAAERATLVVLDRDAQARAAIVSQAAVLHGSGVRVRTLSMFYEHWLGKLPVAELERVSLLFDIGELHRARYSRLKRLVDLALGLAGMVPLILITPFVIAGNLVANRGPLLFRQDRIGKNGQPFVMLKFRTMKPGPGGPVADETGEGRWTATDDPRVTPFGRLLRGSHLDELPQVLNIIRGDLSVVGPRPEQPRYVELLRAKLPFYDIRHLVRPGLTGWAQVKYHYGADEEDALEKLQYEFFYLRNQKLSLDLRIIGRTVRTVFRGEGR